MSALMPADPDEGLLTELEILVARLRQRAGGRGDNGGLVAAGELARCLYRERACRSAHLPSELLGEPAWDILLDLFASQAEGRTISVSSACIGANAPPTTALRYIRRLEQAGWVSRSAAAGDRRRWNLVLTQAGQAAMAAALDRIAAQRSLALAGPRGRTCAACTAKQIDGSNAR